LLKQGQRTAMFGALPQQRTTSAVELKRHAVIALGPGAAA